jgi:hypothetical protein
MKNTVKIIAALFIINAVQLIADTHNTNTAQTINKPYSKKNNPYYAKATKGRQKKPEYYRPGHSDGLQNWPGKTIDAGMNTRMLPTNSASHSGNDVSF